MTTIACDGKTMAADSAIAVRGMRFKEVDNKLWEHNGSIFGGSGDASGLALFRIWQSANFHPADRPDFSGLEFIVLELDPDGTLYEWEGPRVATEVPVPYAIGGGAQIAMGAMLAGADPARAVEIACDIHPDSARPVTVMALP